MAAEGFPAEDISHLLSTDTQAVVWLDLHDPDTADLQVVVEEFGLHPLAVEDAVHDHQRPKLDRYRSHLFANMYAVRFDEHSGELATSEISAFIADRALITVRKADFDVDTLLARWDASPELAASTVGSLVHGLLDALVDGHYSAVEQLDAAVDELEDALFDPRPGLSIRRRGFELRKSLAQLRRSSSRCAAEGVETARDLVGSIHDTELNEQGNQLNEITKKLAAWAAIIAVPTAVTGFYGEIVPYPGFGQHWGFIVSSIVVVVLSGGLYLLLRQAHWL